jgi:2-amino-4-hydroxy-6-hydroxymethyldihydropteridine diphosphokinase
VSAVVLALGSNLGDRLATLQAAVAALAGPPLTATAVSGVYETAPVGGPPQDDYLNAVLLGDWAGSCADLLSRGQAIEAELGRVRAQRWGPRTLDIDVIACGAERSDDPHLTLPHPRAHERAFVLAPWLDADPDAVLPGHGPVAALLAAIGAAGVRRVPGARLTLPAGPQPAVPQPDTAPSDTAPSDTAPSDTGPPDTGLPDPSGAGA